MFFYFLVGKCRQLNCHTVSRKYWKTWEAWIKKVHGSQVCRSHVSSSMGQIFTFNIAFEMCKMKTFSQFYTEIIPQSWPDCEQTLGSHTYMTTWNPDYPHRHSMMKNMHFMNALWHLLEQNFSALSLRGKASDGPHFDLNAGVELLVPHVPHSLDWCSYCFVLQMITGDLDWWQLTTWSSKKSFSLKLGTTDGMCCSCTDDQHAIFWSPSTHLIPGEQHTLPP